MKVVLLLDEVQWAIFAKKFVYCSRLQWVETLGMSDFKRTVLIPVNHLNVAFLDGMELNMLW